MVLSPWGDNREISPCFLSTAASFNMQQQRLSHRVAMFIMVVFPPRSDRYTGLIYGVKEGQGNSGIHTHTLTHKTLSPLESSTFYNPFRFRGCSLQSKGYHNRGKVRAMIFVLHISTTRQFNVLRAGPIPSYPNVLTRFISSTQEAQPA